MKKTLQQNKTVGGSSAVVEVKFYWEVSDENNGFSGDFTVTASDYESCMKIGEEEIAKFGAELMDWHIVE